MNKKFVLSALMASFLLTGCEVEEDTGGLEKYRFDFQSFNLSNIENLSSLADDDINIGLKYENNSEVSIASIHEYGLDESGYFQISEEDIRLPYTFTFSLKNVNDNEILSKRVVSIANDQILFAIGPDDTGDYDLDVFEKPKLSSSASTLTVINYRDLHATYSTSVELDGKEKISSLSPKKLSGQITVDHNEEYKLDILLKGNVLSSCTIPSTSNNVNRVVIFSPENIESLKDGKNCYIFDFDK